MATRLISPKISNYFQSLALSMNIIVGYVQEEGDETIKTYIAGKDNCLLYDGELVSSIDIHFVGEGWRITQIDICAQSGLEHSTEVTLTTYRQLKKLEVFEKICRLP